MPKPFRALRNRLDTYDMTQLQAAEEIGISQTTMTNRMTGQRPWDGAEVIALCRLLEIPRSKIGLYFFPDVAEEYDPS